MSLQVLLTNISLGRLAGTETFVHILAKTLIQKGCKVTCYSPTLGIISDLLAKEGIYSTSDLTGWSKPDVIHAHHTAGFEAHRYFPSVPTVAVHHGPTEPQERPHFKVNLDVSVSEEVQQSLEPPSVIIRNGIDLRRFEYRDRQRLKRLLILPKSSGPWSDELRKQAEEIGMSVESGGPRIFEIEERFEDFDLVAALGRTALEAAACGLPVLVWGPHGSDGLLTAESYREIRKCNFSGRRWRNRTSLNDELNKIGMEKSVRALLEEHHDAEKMASSYLRLYENLTVVDSGCKVEVGG